MIIIKNLIINYLNNLSISDINSLAIKHDIYLNDQELSFIYNFIKDNYYDLVNNPNNYNLSDYKNSFTNENYIKLNNLIKNYKEKYNLN